MPELRRQGSLVTCLQEIQGLSPLALLPPRGARGEVGCVASGWGFSVVVIIESTTKPDYPLRA
jgi:hypothetical protein